MTRDQLHQLSQQLDHSCRCRYWSWEQPEVHHRFLARWPPGYLAALARWEVLPWRCRQLLSVSDHQALQPGLRVWTEELGFELELLSRHTYDEAEFRLLAITATPSMSFLYGLLWRADPEIAVIMETADLVELLRRRRETA